MKKLNGNKALVVLSGGQDSATCLGWALQEWGPENITALTFNYKQRHDVEIECAAKIADYFRVKHIVINTDIFENMSDIALLGRDRDTNINEEKDGLPISFVPGRNMFFLTVAGMYAYNNDIQYIIIGVCQTDYSGYPDCRELSISAIRNALCLCMDADFEIKTPLMYTSKAETFKLAENLGILDLIKYETSTCYEGDRQTGWPWGYGCGACPACKLRAKGWEEYSEVING